MRMEDGRAGAAGWSGSASLGGQVALVTGASSGIGRAIADSLFAAGATVWITGRCDVRLRGIATELGCPDRVRVHDADLTRDGDVFFLVAAVEREGAGLHVLVHSAGLIVPGPIVSASIEDFDAQWRTNVRAPYLLTQCLLPMLELGRGQIVFVNSSAATVARENVGQYSATKHALRAITDSLREEVNGLGLRVLSIFPGRTATPMQAGLAGTEGKGLDPSQLLQPQDVAECVLQALVLPGTAELTDIHVRPRTRAAHVALGAEGSRRPAAESSGCGDRGPHRSVAVPHDPVSVVS